MVRVLVRDAVDFCRPKVVSVRNWFDQAIVTLCYFIVSHDDYAHTASTRHLTVGTLKNKVCPDLSTAIERARNVAAPKNLLRFPGKRPCTDAQRCFDCRSADRSCCIMQILMFKPMQSNKVELILIDEDLGY